MFSKIGSQQNEFSTFFTSATPSKNRFVQHVHSFMIRSSTSGFCPDATNRVTQELVTPKYRGTSEPEQASSNRTWWRTWGRPLMGDPGSRFFS